MKKMKTTNQEILAVLLLLEDWRPSMTKRQITRSQALPKNLFHGTPSMENSPSLTKGMKVIREYIVKKEVGAAVEDVVIVAAVGEVGIVVVVLVLVVVVVVVGVEALGSGSGSDRGSGSSSGRHHLIN